MGHDSNTPLVGCRALILHIVESDRAHKLMVCSTMVLRSVVSVVVLAKIPVDSALALLYPVSEPIESHVNCFGSFLFDGVIDDTSSSAAVVCLEWSRRCLCPNSSRNFCNGTYSRAFMNKAATSASAAEAMTFLMTLASTRIGRLN